MKKIGNMDWITVILALLLGIQEKSFIMQKKRRPEGWLLLRYTAGEVFCGYGVSAGKSLSGMSG